MPFQAVPNGALVTIAGFLDGQLVNNTLGFQWDGGPPIMPVNLQALTTAVADYWGLNMLPILPVQYVMGVVTGRALDVQGGPVYEETGGAGAAGARAGNLLPNNCALVVSFRTGFGGATNRGRNYWPGLLEADVTGSIVATAYANSIATQYDDMVGLDTIATGWRWAVISRKVFAPDPNGRTVPIATAIIRDYVVDSQRRRLPGRGA